MCTHPSLVQTGSRHTIDDTFTSYCWQWRQGPHQYQHCYGAGFFLHHTQLNTHFGISTRRSDSSSFMTTNCAVSSLGSQIPPVVCSTTTALLDIIAACCMWHVRLRLGHRGMEAYVTVSPREWKGSKGLLSVLGSEGETSIASCRHAELHNLNHIQFHQLIQLAIVTSCLLNKYLLISTIGFRR